MPITFTNLGTANTGGSPYTTSVITTLATVPAGALIVVGISDESGGLLTYGVTDSVGNTYNLATSVALNNNPTVAGTALVYYCYNATLLPSGQTITWTDLGNSGIGNNMWVSAAYATNMLATSSVLDTSVTASAYGLSTTPSVTSGTPGVGGELFVGLVGVYSAPTITQAAGWAAPLNAKGGVYSGNLTNTGLTAQTYNPTFSAARQWGAIVVGFLPVAVTGPFNVVSNMHAFNITSIIGY